MEEKDKATEEWENSKRSVELTNDQWNKLDCYILMTTNYRKEMLETWKELAKRTDETGQTEFKNAESNAEFWSNLNETIETIKKKIDEC